MQLDDPAHPFGQQICPGGQLTGQIGHTDGPIGLTTGHLASKSEKNTKDKAN